MEDKTVFNLIQTMYDINIKVNNKVDNISKTSNAAKETNRVKENLFAAIKALKRCHEELSDVYEELLKEKIKHEVIE